MSSCYITIPYHIISYLMFFYFISSAYLISILFYSILLYFKSIWFDLILFSSLLLNLIYYIVQYSISYQWMICVYLPVRLPVCLSVCLSEWTSLCFPFLTLFSFFSRSNLFLFSLFSWTSSSPIHTDTHTGTDTQIHMNICSFLWLVHITSKARKWRIVFEW